MESTGSNVNMNKGILTGVNVLDCGWALVGSLTGKHLADHGAQVIRVEAQWQRECSANICQKKCIVRLTVWIKWAIRYIPLALSV